MAKEKNIKKPWYNRISYWIIIILLLLFGFIIFWQMTSRTMYGTPHYRPKIID